MAGLKRYFEDGAAYFVTAVTKDRRALFLDPKLCRILLVTIEYHKTLFDYKVFAYCVMPDHFHWIVQPSSKFNLSFIMQMIKGSFSRKINKLNQGRGHLWQKRYYDEAIRGERQLTQQIDYVHQNPVKAGLVLAEGDYLHSSYRQYCDHRTDPRDVLEVDGF